MTSDDQTRSAASTWVCTHGTTYSGSAEFISGARNAHDEIAGWLSRSEPRSTNDIAAEIIALCPEATPLIEEWFAVESAARLRMLEAANVR